MKRARPFLLLIALITAFSVTCTDEPQLTEPPDEMVPSMARRQMPPDDHDITRLIQALYPPPGLLEAAMNRWANIYQAVGRGSFPAAQDQARLMIADAMVLLEDEQLRNPPGEEALPLGVTETADGVRLLADLLNSYTDQELQGSADKVIDWIDLSQPGSLETENRWARFSWDAVPGGGEILASIYLQNPEKCDPADEKAAFGCWDFDQFGGGDFERKVEICVADPGSGLTESEYFAELRVHKKNEVTGDTEVLDYENATLDCHCFPDNAPADCPKTIASQETAPSLLTSIGSAVADLLLPDPLGASFPTPRWPPRGIGGTTSSFSDIWGAVPESGADYDPGLVGSEPYADSWVMGAPTEPVLLCNGTAGDGCPGSEVISAVAETGTDVDEAPWSSVYFYYKAHGSSGPITLIGSMDEVTEYSDNGFSRFWTWERILSGEEIPDVGQIDVFAVGVRDPYDPDNPEDAGTVFATDLNSNIRVIPEISLCWVQEEIPVPECVALLAFYEETNGPGWTNKTGWLVDPDPCEWHGVGCTSATTPRSVESLILSANQLSGTIPFELQDLTYLRYLSLPSNQITGSIPPQLGSLSNLRTLDLRGNEVNGSIPPELGNLTDLQTLDLGSNQLDGSIPPELGNLTNLRYLFLIRNELSDEIPAELDGLSSLQSLVLAWNQLSGPIPPRLGNLGNLQVLWLHGNSLSDGIPPELGNLSNLAQLFLYSNQLTGSIPPELGELGSLVSLYLNDNELSGVVPLSVAQLGGSPQLASTCDFDTDTGLTMPDVEEYRAADQDEDGLICHLGFTPLEYSGILSVPQTYVVDLDEGTSTPTLEPPSDVWFEAETATERYLTPVGGAEAAIFGSTAPGMAGCAGLTLSTARIDMQDLPEGTFVCFLTGAGRLSEVEIIGAPGPSPGTLTIGVKTFGW